MIIDDSQTARKAIGSGGNGKANDEKIMSTDKVEPG